MSGLDFGQPLGTLLLFAAIGLLPFAFMALTSFVKITTVLQILKSALGAPGVPSNTVVLALGAALTLIAMAPVGTRVAARLMPLVAQPSVTEEVLPQAVRAIVDPLREFLETNASSREKARFSELLRERSGGTEPLQDDLRVVVPAFLVTELLEAFSLGFAIFLPFLVIDLVVANVLLGLGMQTLNPTQISLPFKLLLFVATDGWGLLAEALVGGY